MGNRYNEQDINRFFENLKNLKNTYDLEKVHRLINNPDAKATQKVKFYFKPLKFIIMTSILMILVSAVLFWPETKENNRNDEIETSISSLKTEREQSSNIIEVEHKEMNLPELKEKKALTVICDKKEIVPKINEDIVVKKTKKEIIKGTSRGVAEDSVYTCDWPSDTVIDKTTLLVKLNIEELEKLGVIVYGSSLFYHNTRFGNSCYIGIESIPQEKKITTRNKYYSCFTSSTNYEPWGASQKYFSSVDTLVPVLIDSEYNNFIFWFNAHKDLFDALPERYGYLRSVFRNLICLKRDYPYKSFVDYSFSSVKDVGETITYLDLNKEEFRRIGINILDNYMVLQSKDLANTYQDSYLHYDCKPDELNGFDSRVDWTDSLNIVRIQKGSFPIVKTDTLGRLFDFYMNWVYPKDSLSTIKDILIPIKIEPKKYFSMSTVEAYLWWFYPTDEFINALPERIKYDLKLERDAIINNTPNEVNSCNYFEACKSTLQLDDLSIYPNPANDIVRIDFSLDEAIDGRITLVNISGSIIKDIVPQTTFMSGLNSYEANLSDVSPGIYLISINTELGFRTQRIIVTR